MSREAEEARQAPLRDQLREAYDANHRVRVDMRDGSQREGVIEEIRDLFGNAPSAETDFLQQTYEIRFHGETEFIRGNRIMTAGPITSGG
ncbi:hypothetical protein E4V01_24000 [Methylorubrum sp. Q1]|uniref:hypothetical protein n=1 Tax=Methylorubrum sp. Q1 TaxID=2562453 RepID=UPI001075CFC2|nr:hypothetical protein [Methylorubrum sp. Q1]TFZ54979.1 hypothetical protein E4V01_24000 [Methylorubrum sp. Q1]